MEFPKRSPTPKPKYTPNTETLTHPDKLPCSNGLRNASRAGTSGPSWGKPPPDSGCLPRHCLGIKIIAQKPYIVWSLGPKALIYESLDSQGLTRASYFHRPRKGSTTRKARTVGYLRPCTSTHTHTIYTRVCISIYMFICICMFIIIIIYIYALAFTQF